MNKTDVIQFAKDRGIQRVELFWIDLDQRWRSMTIPFSEGLVEELASKGANWKGDVPDSPLMDGKNWRWTAENSLFWSCPFSAIPTLSWLGHLRDVSGITDCAEDVRGYARRAESRWVAEGNESKEDLGWRASFSLLRFSDPTLSHSTKVGTGASVTYAPESFVRDFASEWSLMLERTGHGLACWFSDSGPGKVGFETQLKTVCEAADHWAILKRFAKLSADQHMWNASFLAMTGPDCPGSEVVFLTNIQACLDSSRDPARDCSLLAVFANPTVNSFRRIRWKSGQNDVHDLSSDGDMVQWKSDDQILNSQSVLPLSIDGTFNPHLLVAGWVQKELHLDAKSASVFPLERYPLSVSECWSLLKNVDFLLENDVFSVAGLREYRRRRLIEENNIYLNPGPADWELNQ